MWINKIIGRIGILLDPMIQMGILLIIYLIKDRNFWLLKPPGDCSWSWRKILKLRPLIHDKIIKVGGNEISPDTFIWALSPSDPHPKRF
jgi:hypothetical protein